MPNPSSPQKKDRRAGTGSASLATLSAHLGLSMAAISRVLNGAPAARSIPQSTQKRILDAARELNYRPNLLARSLRRGRSMTVGVLVPEMSEGYATAVLAGLEETLSAAGYVFILITHHHRAEVLARSHEMFTERAVDGVVAVDTVLPDGGPVPTVTISCPDPHPHVTNIVLNHARAAEMALGHLHALGHRRIAVIKGQPFSSDTQPRWSAIEAAAAALALELPPDRVAQMEEDLATDEPGFLATQRLLAGGADFTALFAFNDVSAFGAIRALQLAGRRVPEDVSVVGFDDIRMAAYHHPALTTMRQPLHRMGVLAAQTVLRKLAEGDRSAVDDDPREVIEAELIVRASTAPPPTPTQASPGEPAS